MFKADRLATAQTPSPRPAKLSAVQALRGAASVAVVLCHAARHVNKAFHAPMLIEIFQAGHAGVDLFFVISGFIILFVHRSDIGRATRLAHYARRRFYRVMPLYWIALSITIALSLAGGHPLPPLRHIFWSATLLPSAGEPLLGIAWTLQYELVFYAVFALLIVNRFIGAIAFTAWFACIVFTALGHALPHVPPQLSGPYGLEFFMGLTAAFLVQRNIFGGAPFIAFLGCFSFCACLIAESLGLLDGFGTVARCAYGGSALLLVSGVAAAESFGRIAPPGWLGQAGEASYSIYLFQFVFIGLVWQGWTKLGLAHAQTNIPCFLALSVAAIAGGLLTSRLVEYPLLRLIRRAASA